MFWFTELPGRRRYSRVSTGVPPQHRGDEDDEAPDGNLGLLFAGSYALGEEKVVEVRTEPSSSFPGLSGEVLERQEPTEPELMEVFHGGEAAEE